MFSPGRIIYPEMLLFVPVLQIGIVKKLPLFLTSISKLQGKSRPEHNQISVLL